MIELAECARPYTEASSFALMFPIIGLRLVTGRNKGLATRKIPTHTLIVRRIAISLRMGLMRSIIITTRSWAGLGMERAMLIMVWRKSQSATMVVYPIIPFGTSWCSIMGRTFAWSSLPLRLRSTRIIRTMLGMLTPALRSTIRI